MNVLKLLIFLLATKICLAHSQDIPSIPNSLLPPNALTLDCFQKAKTFPMLEVCRVAAEAVRDAAEDYNNRITRFCHRLIQHDGLLREKAKMGKLSWSDYEELKLKIQSTLDECDPKQGDHFSSYRARIREYRSALELYTLAKESIVKGVGL